MIALRLFVLVFALVVFAAPVMAEEKAADDKAPAAVEAVKEEAPAEAKAEEVKEEDTAPKREKSETAKKMYKSVSKFAMNLKPPQMQHFYLTFNNYNLIRSVDEVRDSVGNAVNSCIEKNPDMKDKIESRHTKWIEAIQPSYNEAQANLDNMMIAQDYAKPEEIKDIFKQVDATRAEAKDKFEKIPVSTPEACDFMLGKMDETQESLLSLLRATLISYPQSIPGFVPPEGEQKKPEEKNG